MLELNETPLSIFEKDMNKDKIREDLSKIKFTLKMDDISFIYDFHYKKFDVIKSDSFVMQNNRFSLLSIPISAFYYHDVTFTFENNKEDISEFLKVYNEYKFEYENIDDFYKKELYKEYGYELKDDHFSLTVKVKDLSDNSKDPRFHKKVDYTKRSVSLDHIIDRVYDESVNLISKVNNHIIASKSDSMYRLVITGTIPADQLQLSDLSMDRSLFKSLSNEYFESIITYEWLEEQSRVTYNDLEIYLDKLSDSFIIDFIDWVFFKHKDVLLMNIFISNNSNYIHKHNDIYEFTKNLLSEDNLKDVKPGLININPLFDKSDDKIIMIKPDHKRFKVIDNKMQPIFVEDANFAYMNVRKPNLYIGRREIKLELEFKMEEYSIQCEKLKNTNHFFNFRDMIRDIKHGLDNFRVGTIEDFEFDETGILILEKDLLI